MNIDANKLSQEIDTAFKQLRFHPMLESESFAIFERNGIQVQVLITKDKSEFCDEIVSGIADA